MKRKSIYTLSILFTLGAFALSFNLTSDDNPLRALNDTEMLNFGQKHLVDRNMKFSSIRMHAYDDSQYSIIIDKKGEIELSRVFGCQDQHQNELDINFAKGKIQRFGDTLFVSSQTDYKNFYLFKLEKGTKPILFAPELEIKVVSSTLNGENCQNLVSANDFNAKIVALPKGVPTDELFKHKHPKKTIGVFSYFSIKDSEGQNIQLEQGDYVLVGGNSITTRP